MKVLSSWVWLLFGVCIMVVALVYGWSKYSPNEKETEMLKANTIDCQNQAAQKSKAEKRVKDAIQTVKTAAQAWGSIEQQKTPGTQLADGGIDISKDSAHLILDAPKFRDSTQRAVNHQLLVGGVKPLGGPGPEITHPGSEPSTIMADYFNYPAIPFPVVICDLGTVTVEGTYDQIMTNVRSWANMPHYMAVSDGLSITGTSPKMHGTYSVSLIGFIRGNKVFFPIPEVPSSGQSGSGPGQSLGGGGLHS
jgi:hypothetical protein